MSNESSFYEKSNNQSFYERAISVLNETDEATRLSAKEIDVNLINQSLANVNNFSKRRQADKLPSILMYEIPASGDSFFRNMTLRELFNYIVSEAVLIDEVALEKDEEAKLKTMVPFQEDSDKDSSKDAQKNIDASTQKKPISAKLVEPLVHHKAPSSLPSVMAAKSFVPPVSAGALPRRSMQKSKLGKIKEEISLSEEFVDGEEVKYSAASELRLRDLRRLDFQFNPNEEKSILIRRHVVLFAMV